MAEQKLRPFKWLEGVLHLRIGDKVHIVGPGDVVDNPEHLAALGAERIQVLMTEGKCVPQGDPTPPTSAPLSEAEKTEAQANAQASLDEDAASYKLQKANQENLKAMGAAPPIRDLGTVPAPAANASRGIGGAGPINPSVTQK